MKHRWENNLLRKQVDFSSTGILILFSVVLINHAKCSVLDQDSDLDSSLNIAEDGDSDNDHEISVQYCLENYPFTYSKCLSLCDINLDPTCLDDQLCLCDSAQLQTINTSWPTKHSTEFQADDFGARRNVSCRSNDFCGDLCRNDEKLGFFVNKHVDTNLQINGALCTHVDEFNEEVESCICSIN